MSGYVPLHFGGSRHNHNDIFQAKIVPNYDFKTCNSLENRLKVIFGYFLKNNSIMTVFRSRHIKNGLRRFILFLDVGIVYTLIILEDFFKIVFFVVVFFCPKSPKRTFFDRKW